MRRHGNTNKYSPYDPNEIVIKNNYAEIIMKDKEGIETGRTLISKSKINICKLYKFSLSGNGYAITPIKGHNEYLHRIIKECPKGYVIDHINRRKLDNTDENLRVATISENILNQCICKINKSGFRGVCYDKSRNKWKATLKVKNKMVLNKRFDKIEDAILSVETFHKMYGII